MTLLAQEVATPAAAPVQRRFRPDIEGLRALAVLMVVLYHAGASWLPGGYVGVDVFFVLSGFLITGILLREAQSRGTVSISGFYARRARRILPASMLVVVATVVAAHGLLNFVRAGTVYSDARWATGFLANYHFSAVGTDYLQAAAPPSPLQHFWSLAVEEQFYVVWPLVVLVVARLTPRRHLRAGLGVVLAVLTIGSLAWSVHDTQVSATTAFFSPFTRAWELGAGALLAVAAPLLTKLPRRSGPVLGVVGIVAVLGAALVYTARTPFPGSAALLPVLGTALVVAAGTAAPGTGVELALRWSPFQRLGSLSFSWYLWHWPILVIAAGWVGHPLSFGANLLLAAAALVLAYVTFDLIEDPLRRSPRLVGHTSNSLGFGVAAVAVTLFVTNVFTSLQLTASDAAVAAASSHQAVTFAAEPSAPAVVHGHAETRVSPVVAAVIAAAKVRTLPADLTPALSRLPQSASPANYDGCQVAADKVTSPTCRYGDVGSHRLVVLFGDSHASQWLPALAAAGSRQHFAVVLLAKSLCPFPTMTLYEKVLGRPFTECNAWRTWALGRIASLHPDLVVASSTVYGVSLPSSPTDQAGVEDAWAKGSATTVAALKAAAGRVVVLGDAPVEVTDPADCLASHANDIQQCSVQRADALTADHDQLQRQVASQDHVGYVDTVDWFCSQAVCPMVVAGMVTHFDQWHLTAVYAASLSAPLSAALGLAHWR